MPYPDLPRPHVPGPIAIVRDFANTENRETAVDELVTTEGLVRYLRAEGLLTGPARATTGDLDLARRLRANLRLALEENHDLTDDPLPGLAGIMSELPVELSWSTAGPVVQARETGVVGALAEIGIAAHEAAGRGLWRRLKICSFDGCQWAYYDHSKNQSRQWCEYGCGNRVKTRAYRARRRADAPP